jgi:hydroxypyruvate isomerase
MAVGSGRLVASANISTLYAELPFAERLERAAQDGFACVEFWQPDDATTIGAAVAAAGLDVSCVNVPSGWEPGDCGRMADAAAVEWWRERFTETVQLALDVGSKRINVLAGRGGGTSAEEDLATVAGNLTWALEATAAESIVLLLEAVNVTDRPGYLWPSISDVVAVREHMGAPERLKVSFDTYHVQQAHEDVTETFLDCRDAVGHIQLADFPGRGEPGTGEIDFASLLRAIEASDYDQYIGLEYRPSASTSETLGWISEFSEWLDWPSRATG